MVAHPYASAPNNAFWSRAVSRAWKPSEVLHTEQKLIRKGDKVVSAGSCFASNIVPYLEKSGFTYLRTEETHPAFADLDPEPFGYAKFSAAYGNIYTARQLLQLLKRCMKLFSPIEDRWIVGDKVVDPYRPGLRYYARSHREFDLLTQQHLNRTREAFEKASVFVFTLGLTEAWVSELDGAVFPACPGTVAGSYDPARHKFVNFGVAEIAADLDAVVELLKQMNPAIRIILTVSPVPLVATATGNHVLAASTYSKSVLRVVAGEVAERHTDVTYFPSYELVTGPQAPKDFFEEDRRNVSSAGVDVVMGAMLAHCEGEASGQETAGDQASAAQISLPSAPVPRPRTEGVVDISQLIVEAECEEAMSDR
jgi:hypothetical protein